MIPSLFSLRLSTLSVLLRFITCAMYVTPVWSKTSAQAARSVRVGIRTRRSFPRRSSVRRAPRRGRLSNARTLSKSAALGPWWCGCAPLLLCGAEDAGGTGWRVVTPPVAEDVMIGTCWPDGLSGFVSGAAAAARFARGMYGVYVVWSDVVGCFGGGGSGPVRTGGGGRLETGKAGEPGSVEGGGFGDIGGVDGFELVGVAPPGTTSG